MVYLQTTYELCFGGSVFWIFWIMWFFQWKYKYRCIHVYVRFKDDKHVIWMWIWLILKNISLLDRIWSLWLVFFPLTRHQTSYSGSAGWYFRYQSIHIQIAYTYLIFYILLWILLVNKVNVWKPWIFNTRSVCPLHF